jgi:uncharacterized protein (TIGR01777 family)
VRYAITGATGLIGAALAASVAADGHDVVGISRSPEAAVGRVPSLTAAFAPDDPRATRGADVVVHLAGEPVAGRWTAAKRARIRDSRIDGTRQLVDLLRELSPQERPKALISTSAVGFYGDRGDDELDEASAPGDDYLARVCQDWESEAHQATALGVRVVCIRFGIVLSPAGGALQEMLRPAKLGVSGPLGRGRQWWSWLHLDDAVRLIRFAAEGDIEGALAGCTEHPVRQRDFAKALGRALGRPAFLPAPGWALRLILGGFATELLTSKRLLPRRALEAGFEFDHPELAGALEDLLR